VVADSTDRPYVEQPELGYASMSHAAVASCVCGVLSVLVLVRLTSYNVFLTFAGVAVVCGLVGYRRIARSEGALAGKWLAVIGLNLGLGFGVVGAAVPTIQHIRARKIITGLAERVVGLIAAGDLEKAYAMTDSAFQAQNSLDQFGTGGYIPRLREAGALKTLSFAAMQQHGYEAGGEGFIIAIFDGDFAKGKLQVLIRAVDKDGWKIAGIDPPPTLSYLDIQRKREKER